MTVRIEELADIGPEAAFLALRGEGRAFMLSGWADPGRRHSVIGAGPILEVRTENGVTTVTDNAGARVAPDPFSAMAEVLKTYGLKQPAPSPFAFNCGLAGYLSYDLKDIIEPVLLAGKAPKTGGLGLPDCIMGLYDPVFIYDHASGKGSLISIISGTERFHKFKAMLQGPIKAPKPNSPRAKSFESNTGKEDYIRSLIRAKDYISSGDIYQINLSHRLRIPCAGDGFGLYLSLIGQNPATFSSFFDYGGFQVISNSPERLIKIKDGVITTSPIKGTRPRSESPERDSAFIEELRASLKERSEHVMIVDLERSDLGRICVAGSVEVSSFEEIESYATVHHMVSTIQGILAPGTSPAGALRAVFPGGSVTGAPKIRAMEIIDELEAAPRGIYTGAIGWSGLNGELDMAMAIRTAVYKDGSLYLNVGGGIVADSDPEAEYQETITKAMDFFKALGIGP